MGFEVFGLVLQKCLSGRIGDRAVGVLPILFCLWLTLPRELLRLTVAKLVEAIGFLGMTARLLVSYILLLRILMEFLLRPSSWLLQLIRSGDRPPNLLFHHPMKIYKDSSTHVQIGQSQ
jgi:hypothetical protein